MSSFPFVGAAYVARSKTFDAQELVNLYVETSGSGSSKSPAALIGTPGLSTWATVGTGPIIAAIKFSETQAIVVSGSSAYSVTPAGAATLIGSVGSGGKASIASNGQLVAVASGNSLSIIDPSTLKVTVASSSAGDNVTCVDGYFVFNEASTARFRTSGLLSGTVDPLDFATVEGAPGNLIGLIADHRELWLMKTSSTEVWFNSGGQDFPFERIQGAYIEHGCAAAGSIAKIDNTVFWLSADDRGQGIVFRASGYQPQRISTHALEYEFGKYSTLSDAVAWTYQQEGHSFYVLSFPTMDVTWAYDCSTGLWHRRAYLNANSTLGRHRGQCAFQFAGKTLVGDWSSGKIYKLDLDVLTDDGNAIPRIRVAPHIADDLKNVIVDSLQIDMETGVGLSIGQGNDPQAMLQWSTDGGFTWSNELWASIGKIGERRSRVRWRRLGRARDRVFKVTITDPVKVAIVGASISARAANV